MRIDLRPRPQQRRLLLIAGSDAHDTPVTGRETISTVGSTDIYKLLGRDVPYDRLHVTPNFFRQNRRPELGPYDCLFNLVTDPDQNPRVLENVRKLVKGDEQRVINRPEAVLRCTRDQVARRLSGIAGLRVPMTLRLRTGKREVALAAIEKAGLAYPVIVRVTGSHGGRILGRFEGPDALTLALEPGREHFVTEFVDFQSCDGVYRKYRVFFIGRHRVFRHMLGSAHWNVHVGDAEPFMAERPDLREQEQGLSARAEGAFPEPIHEVLRQVQERMGLDLFGMDFGITDAGKVVLFEANPTMNFLSNKRREGDFAYTLRPGVPARAAMLELVGAIAPVTDLPTA